MTRSKLSKVGKSALAGRALVCLMLGSLGCSDDSPPAAGDAGRDGATDLLVFGDLNQGPDACLGQGCPCATDDPCVAAGDNTICLEGSCQPGCNDNVPCADINQQCCNNACISGCCNNRDCPAGQICDPDTHLCGSCSSDAECGPEARCCGEPGAMSCALGDCCETGDCQAGLICAANTCTESCTTQEPCPEDKVCCGGACFPGECCANPDCSDGRICQDNSCVPCTTDSQCGTGKICDTGGCVVGCNAQTGCGAGSICCSSTGLCDNSSPGCEGSCFVGACCSDGDCEAGEVCGADHLCHGPCIGDAQCSDGQRCCDGLCYSGGCVDTLAGSGRTGIADQLIGEAHINGIYDMVPDGKGNLIFTEPYGGVVRAINNSTGSTLGRVAPGSVGRLTSGIIGCKAGPANLAEMRQPMGLARDSSGNTYVADGLCGVIWQISADYQTVSVLAGNPGSRDVVDGQGTTARLHNPRGLTIGPNDVLYFSEYAQHLIRQVTLAGVVTTIAGSKGVDDEVDGAALTAARFSNPAGLAIDAGGTLFVGDYTSGAVRKIDGIYTGNALVSTIVPTQEDPDPDPRRRWLRPHGYAAHSSLSVGASQSVHINFWNNGTWTLTPPGGSGGWTATKILTSKAYVINNTLESTQIIWLGGWVNGGATSNSNTIERYNLSTNQSLQTVGRPGLMGVSDGDKNEATFLFGSCNGALTVDSAGNTWVADYCAHRVRKITPAGVVSSFGTGRAAATAGTATTAEFCKPAAITAVGTTIYVVNRDCGRQIMQIAANGNVTIRGDICPASEEGIHENGTSDLCPQPSPIGGMVADAAGNLYVTTYQEPGAGRSDKYRVGGQLSYWDGMPMIVKVPNHGAGAPVWFAGTPNNPYDPAKRNTCRDGALGTGQFGTWPYGLAIDSSGYLYVGDNACGVRKVAPDGTITTLESSFGAIGVAIGPGPNGDETLFASRGGNAIWTVDRLSGQIAAFAGGQWSWDNHFQDGALSVARFWEPYSLAVDGQGRILVLDRRNSRVRVIRQ